MSALAFISYWDPTLNTDTFAQNVRMAIRCRIRKSNAHTSPPANTSWLRVPPAQPPVRTKARSPEWSRPGGPSAGGDESPGADGVVSYSVASLVEPIRYVLWRVNGDTARDVLWSAHAAGPGP
jgi:hypothetical protein